MSRKNTFLLVICTFTLLYEIWPGSNAEVFSAIADLPPLLNTYKLIIDDLDEYIQKEERRLFALKKNIDVFKREHAIAIEDISNYLENPINAFTLIKRLTIDLKVIEQNANLTTEFIRNMTKNKANAVFPDNEDLSGAATALTRLQDTYKLQVDELAEGKINGVSYSLPMSADDCFGLGHILYSNADYKLCIEWLLKALQKYKEGEGTDVFTFTPVDILEYVSSSYDSLGDAQNASVWVKKILAIDPNNDQAQINLRLFEKKITEKVIEEPSLAAETNVTGTNITFNSDLYKALCRGEYELAPEITKRLICFYFTKNHAFLRLAPFKAEQLYFNPDVFIFYDIINDVENEHILALAKPKLKRAKVNHINKTVVSPNRVSKNVFLKHDDVIGRIRRRLADFTGLNMASSEIIQVVNYGIGGQFEPHFDHARKHTPNHTLLISKQGNRIATVLFYMSEVAQGGATAFTELGLSVFPVKNAALFWMNLHPSGEGDLSTMHGACPVLRGSKWISTIWIRVVGQEFHRPCSLEYQEEDILRQLPAPVPKSSM